MARYDIGDRVTHSQYGDGTVTGWNEYHTRIDFDEHGKRTFASSLVTLGSTTSVAPVRAKEKRARKSQATSKSL